MSPRQPVPCANRVGVQITQQASANKHPLMKYHVSVTETQDWSLHAGQVGGRDLPTTSWRAICKPRAECFSYTSSLSKTSNQDGARSVEECVKVEHAVKAPACLHSKAHN